MKKQLHVKIPPLLLLLLLLLHLLNCEVNARFDLCGAVEAAIYVWVEAAVFVLVPCKPFLKNNKLRRMVREKKRGMQTHLTKINILVLLLLLSR